MKISHSRGFTIAEILIAMVIMGSIASLGLFFGLDAYRFTTVRTERDTVVGILQRARSEAMNNLGQKSHGVHVGTAEYSLFAGDFFNPSDENNVDLPIGSGITVSGLTDIVFTQLSGAARTVGSLTLNDGNTSAAIFINSIGGINW